MATEPEVFTLGLVTIELGADYTVTLFADGTRVYAAHEDVGHLGQIGTAQDLGYATVPLMNRDHDIVHTLLDAWVGTGEGSPVLRAEALGTPCPTGWHEEACVLAIQRLLVARGVQAHELLVRACERQRGA